MNMAGVMKNPVVWGGGALLGVVLLFRSSGANSNAQSNLAAVNPAVMSANVQMNAAALGAEVERASIAADFGKAQYAANVADHANVLSFLKAQDDNQTLLGVQRIQANAGITNSLIQSSTAIIVDEANNANRLGLGWQQVQIAQIQSDRDVDIAQYQYKGIKAASKANIIGNIVGTVGKLATVGISAATGMPLPRGGF